MQQDTQIAAIKSNSLNRELQAMHALVQYFYYINNLFTAGGWFTLFYVLHGVLHRIASFFHFLTKTFQYLDFSPSYCWQKIDRSLSCCECIMELTSNIPNFFVCRFSAYKHQASQITHMQITCMPKSAYKDLLNISQNHSSKECLNYFRRASVSVGWSGDLLCPHTLPGTPHNHRTSSL